MDTSSQKLSEQATIIVRDDTTIYIVNQRPDRNGVYYNDCMEEIERRGISGPTSSAVVLDFVKMPDHPQMTTESSDVYKIIWDTNS